MKGFLLDTHIWLWYLGGSSRLPKGLRQLIDEGPSDCWLSPISLWEAGMLASRGRIKIPCSFRDWVGQAMQKFVVSEAAINHEVALLTHEINLAHEDPADHLIAASALVFDLTLLTVDERLAKARWLPTRSR